MSQPLAAPDTMRATAKPRPVPTALAAIHQPDREAYRCSTSHWNSPITAPIPRPSRSPPRRHQSRAGPQPRQQRAPQHPQERAHDKAQAADRADQRPLEPEAPPGGLQANQRVLSVSSSSPPFLIDAISPGTRRDHRSHPGPAGPRLPIRRRSIRHRLRVHRTEVRPSAVPLLPAGMRAGAKAICRPPRSPKPPDACYRAVKAPRAAPTMCERTYRYWATGNSRAKQPFAGTRAEDLPRPSSLRGD